MHTNNPTFRSLRIREILIGLFLVAFGLPLPAAQFGLFTYEITLGGVVQIMGYPKDAVGTVAIPATIAGRPVAIIGYDAFADCTGVTGITLPSSMEIIEPVAFR